MRLEAFEYWHEIVGGLQVIKGPGVHRIANTTITTVVDLKYLHKKKKINKFFTIIIE